MVDPTQLIGTLHGDASIGGQSTTLNMGFDFIDVGLSLPHLTFQYDTLTLRFVSDASTGGGTGTGFMIRFETFDPCMQPSESCIVG